MRFYVRKRRQPPGVIIVALIDILIVLLIFLMVTTTFTQQPAVKLSLPESTSAQPGGANETPPLMVTIDAQGNLRLGVEAKPVTLAELRAEVMAAVAKNPRVKMAIGGDKAAPWGQVLKVMDIARESNLKEKVVSAFVKDAQK